MCRLSRDGLIQAIREDHQRGRDIDILAPPDRKALGVLMDGLLELIFPAPDASPEALWDTLAPLAGEERTAAFFRQIPLLREKIQLDLEAAFLGDPAATGPAEILGCYPGFRAITVYRLAHGLYTLGLPLIPRYLTEQAHSASGIDIHPGAEIGRSFFIDHGTGIVIGQTTVIGDNVKLYQGVTLGGLSTRGGQALRDKKRHPTLEDGVTVYANATILGGDTVIGAGSTIGANAFITKSVPPGSTVKA